MLELPLIALALAQTPRFGLHLRSSFETELAVAAEDCLDLDGRPGSELLIVAADGAVRTFGLDPATRSFAPTPRGTLVLPDPAHSLMHVAHVLDTPAQIESQTRIDGQKRADGEPRPQLVVADARGVFLYRAGEQGAFEAGPDGPTELVPRYRQRLRLDGPTLAPIVQDVNGDGRDDLVLPSGDQVEVWIRGSMATEQKPAFTRAAQVSVDVSHSQETSADELSDVLTASLSIPDLALQDVNGDGRPDLLVRDGERRAWHLVRADGTIPEQPDVVLDLSIFKDTTPAAELATGRTLAGGDQTQLETRDLDGDGIPDYVIAHRRKVWVFQGTKNGPQFTQPTTILKAADDVTALLVVALDDDARPDLVLFKLQIPSVGEILRGLVSEWSLDLECAGYRNKDGKSFDTSPAWRSTIEVRLPAILDIARDPEKLLKRFEDVGKKFRTPEQLDLDGDGQGDIVLTTSDKKALELWRGAGGAGPTGREDEALLRHLLFEDPEKTWDLDRVLAFLGGWAEQRVARITGARPADARFDLRDPAKFTLLGLRPCDVDGDKSVELLAEYLDIEHPSKRVIDVLAAR